MDDSHNRRFIMAKDKHQGATYQQLLRLFKKDGEPLTLRQELALKDAEHYDKRIQNAGFTRINGKVSRVHRLQAGWNAMGAMESGMDRLRLINEACQCLKRAVEIFDELGRGS
jgi:dipeptidase